MKNFTVLTGGIYFPQIKTLCVSDLQLGFEDSLRKQGINLPFSQFELIKKLFLQMFAELKNTNQVVEKVVINGDLKHEFSKLTEQELREIEKTIIFLKEQHLEVKIVKGNHDNYVAKPAIKHGIMPFDYLIEESLLFIHGDQIPEESLLYSNKEIETIVIGHEHPAISIKDELGSKHKFKCALIGVWKFKGKNMSKTFELIVLPAMSPLAGGTPVNETLPKHLLSPILQQCDIGEFVPFLIQDDFVKEFPKIKHIRT